MADADLVMTGTVLTVDDARPTAEAIAVADGKDILLTVRGCRPGWRQHGSSSGAGCVMPGFVEAHGHPLLEAVVLSDRFVDIRPVTMRDADDVVAAIRGEVARRGPAGAYLVGWDPLLQSGLGEPT
ncbi:hypothetical protein J113_03950 [Mycobacterium tuberculosis CAS/NITR204]|uniref:Amidohydrolase n=1 Tax=Mycobacterium tuberculosis CAS/NITR204 TaxID=1310114 RepID=R4MEX1_MYCTX|nr:hypothetical protein J113_03950 [Mycobacterium tuberculosis CAS/NITR204]